MKRRLTDAFLAFCLVFPPLASAEPERGWRCMSKNTGTCEQEIYNDIEQLAHRNFEALPNTYGLKLKALRVGERLVTGYLEGEMKVGDKKYPRQILEITYDPGVDVDGTAIPSLGIIRYAVGDGDVDGNGQSLWMASNSSSSAVKAFYAEILRTTFHRAARQAAGLDVPVGTPPVSTPQTCWRGCGKDSDERRFHEITMLAKSVMAIHPTQTSKIPLKLSCVYYRPKGTFQYPEPHYEASGRFEQTFDINYESNLKPSALELFTDSALVVLEGQIRIAGQATQVQISTSYNAGQAIGGSLIPGLGGDWNSLTGPDTTNFWERSDFDIAVKDAVPVFRQQELGVKYPREVHCFEPGKEPTYPYLQNPVEYDKLNYRERNTLPKSLQELMTKVRAAILNSFALAVKVHIKQATLTEEEFKTYRAGYFQENLNGVMGRLQTSYNEASRQITLSQKAESDVKPLLDECRQAIESAKSPADLLLSLKDRLTKASQASCNGNLNGVSYALKRLTENFDSFLRFQSDAATTFALAGKSADFDAAFAGVKPSIEAVDKSLSELEGILETDGPCQKITKAFSGIALKLDVQAMAGDADTLSKVSTSVLDALKKAAAAKEVTAVELRMTTRFEELAGKHNSGTADLSYSQGQSSLDEIQIFLDQEVKIAVDSLLVADSSQKVASKAKFQKRREALAEEFQQLVQDAGGPAAMVRARIGFAYEPKIDKLLPAIAHQTAVEQKAFMGTWLRVFTDNGIDLSPSCLDAATALASRDLCWRIPALPSSASVKDLVDYDKRVTNIVNHAQSSLDRIGD